MTTISNAFQQLGGKALKGLTCRLVRSVNLENKAGSYCRRKAT